jgi:hypothetical protein
MRKTFCDKCGDEITENVIMVFNHEVCPKCANAVDAFITRSPRTPTMDALRNFCENFNKNCSECPFYDEDSCDDCRLKNVPCNWSSEEETYSKLLDYKVNHPDWRKKE